MTAGSRRFIDRVFNRNAQVRGYRWRLHEGIFWQVAQPNQYLSITEQVSSWQTANITQRRLKAIGAASKQEQIQLTVNQAGDIAKTAQAHLV